MKLIIIVFLGFVILSSFVAAFQYAGMDNMYLPSQRDAINAGGYRRAMGLADHFSQLGLYCTAAIPLSLMLALTQKKMTHSVLWAIPAVFALAGLTFTALRSGVIGAFLGLSIAMFIWNRKKMISYFLKYGLILILLFAVTPVLRESSSGIIEHTSKVDVSAMNRPKLAGIGFDMFMTSPLFGVGPEGPEKGNIDPHNTFVNVLSDYGLFGFAVFIAIAIATIRRPLKIYRRFNNHDGLFIGLYGSAIATYVVAFFHSVNYIQLFWLFPALSLSLSRIMWEITSNNDKAVSESVGSVEQEKVDTRRCRLK